MKRILAWLLCLAMLLSLMAMPVRACPKSTAIIFNGISPLCPSFLLLYHHFSPLTITHICNFSASFSSLWAVFFAFMLKSAKKYEILAIISCNGYFFCYNDTIVEKIGCFFNPTQ